MKKNVNHYWLVVVCARAAARLSSSAERAGLAALLMLCLLLKIPAHATSLARPLKLGSLRRLKSQPPACLRRVWQSHLD